MVATEAHLHPTQQRAARPRHIHIHMPAPASQPSPPSQAPPAKPPQPAKAPFRSAHLQSRLSSFRMSWLISWGPSGRTRMPCRQEPGAQLVACQAAALLSHQPSARAISARRQLSSAHLALSADFQHPSTPAPPSPPTLMSEMAMASFLTRPGSCLTMRWMNWWGAQNTSTLASLQGAPGQGRAGCGRAGQGRVRQGRAGQHKFSGGGRRCKRGIAGSSGVALCSRVCVRVGLWAAPRHAAAPSLT